MLRFSRRDAVYRLSGVTASRYLNQRNVNLHQWRPANPKAAYSAGTADGCNSASDCRMTLTDPCNASVAIIAATTIGPPGAGAEHASGG